MSTTKSKKILLLGANGDIGKRVLQGLLESGHDVKAVVRSKNKLEDMNQHPKLSILEASILDMPLLSLRELVNKSDVTISCVGHGPNIFGEPKRILLNVVQSICSVMTPSNKLILLNGAAARHPDGSEATGWIESIIVRLLNFFLPPHTDMEESLTYLEGEDTKNWIAMRPGLFVNGNNVTKYSLTTHRRVGLFSGRGVTKCNVADSIVQMTINEDLQAKWCRKMPVVIDDLE